MRLAITKSGVYHADQYCTDARSAKKVLREQIVSVLAIDHDLQGKGNGCEIILWAEQAGRLPSLVVVIERNRYKRELLSRVLLNLSYQSADKVNFIRR